MVETSLIRLHILNHSQKFAAELSARDLADREGAFPKSARNKKPPACAGGSSLRSWGNLPIEQQQQQRQHPC